MYVKYNALVIKEMKGFIILVLFIVTHTNSTLEKVNHRVKRKVLFTKNSKLFVSHYEVE